MLKHREGGVLPLDDTSTELDGWMAEDPEVWEGEEPRAGATVGAAFFGWLVASATVALIATILAAASAVIGFSELEREYEVLAHVDWPATPITDGPVTPTEFVLMSLAVLATLGAAVAGGRTGNRYHQRFDLN